MANGIGDKVDFLLTLAKKKEYNSGELKKVISMTGEHTDNKILGRVFGYSVSDYALAVLNWLNTDESIKAFHTVYDRLDKIRQAEVTKLIDEQVYLDY